jgi:hypothetical protein
LQKHATAAPLAFSRNQAGEGYSERRADPSLIGTL